MVDKNGGTSKTDVLIVSFFSDKTLEGSSASTMYYLIIIRGKAKVTFGSMSNAVMRG